jgi:hypothetical protein
VSEYEQLVDPQDLVIVTFEEPLGFPHEILAVSCAYVPFTTDKGQRVIALEVWSDPAHPAPQEPYYCPAGRLKRIRIAPRRVRQVRPYSGG